MIGKSLIIRSLKCLTNNKIPVKDMVIIHHSALVMRDLKQGCHRVTFAVQKPKAWKAVQEAFPHAEETLTDDGFPIISFELIKALPMDFMVMTLEPETYDKVEDLAVQTIEELVDYMENIGDDNTAEYLVDTANGVYTVERLTRELRSIYRGLEDITETRIRDGQRVLACFKDTELGLSAGESEEKAQKALKIVEGNYKLLTDGIVTLTKRNFEESLRRATELKDPDQFQTALNSITEDYQKLKDRKTSMTSAAFLKALKALHLKGESSYIDNYSKMIMVDLYMSAKEQEETIVKNLKGVLKDIPIWSEFLVHVNGCGPKLGAAIISELNIEAAKYPQSFIKYLGMDVVEDPDTCAKDEEGNPIPGTGTMIGRRNWKRLMSKVEYIDSDGEITETTSLGYKARMKAKMVFVLGGCLQKAGGYYKTEVYTPYKTRLENRPDLMDEYEGDKMVKDKKGKRHAMAMRYMVKQFIIDLHIFWKKLHEDVDVECYAVAKLGRKHGRKTFIECLAMAKAEGGKPEDYVGVANRPIPGHKQMPSEYYLTH